MNTKNKDKFTKDELLTVIYDYINSNDLSKKSSYTAIQDIINLISFGKEV